MTSLDRFFPHTLTAMALTEVICLGALIGGAALILSGHNALGMVLAFPASLYGGAWAGYEFAKLHPR